MKPKTKIEAAGVSGTIIVLLTMMAGGSGSARARQQEHGPFRLEPVAQGTVSAFPQNLAGLVQVQGTRLWINMNGQQTEYCDVWWRREIPAAAAPAPGAAPSAAAPDRAGAANDDLLYPRLSSGEFLGLLYFPAQEEDSRDQKLDSGFYTMRYWRLPPDDALAQTSPYREFVLLSPAGADTQVESAGDHERLLSLSRSAAKSEQPALLDLQPPVTGHPSLPSTNTDDAGNCALEAKLHARALGAAATKARDFELSVLLYTPPKDTGAS